MSDSEQFWFNTRTNQVDVGHQSSAAHLLGPYGSRAEAERALSTAAARTQAWDQDAEDD